MPHMLSNISCCILLLDTADRYLHSEGRGRFQSVGMAMIRERARERDRSDCSGG